MRSSGFKPLFGWRFVCCIWFWFTSDTILGEAMTFLCMWFMSLALLIPELLTRSPRDPEPEIKLESVFRLPINNTPVLLDCPQNSPNTLGLLSAILGGGGISFLCLGFTLLSRLILEPRPREPRPPDCPRDLPKTLGSFVLSSVLYPGIPG